MASTNITRTPASNGNQKVWTWSGWIKNNGKSGDSTYQYLMEAYYGNGYRYSYVCLRHGTIETYGGDYSTSSSSMSFDVTTNKLLRDPSAWYHVVVSFDSTQSTSTDRLKIYINGEQQTSFQGYVGSGASATFPAQDDVTFFNVTTTQNRIGKNFDGSMAHVHFVDGTAYAASTFGETDSTSGIWVPKTSPSVTYGTNGFFLKFADSSNLDLDSSGNNHTFATSGTLTQNVDTPSNNFATLNPLHSTGNSTLPALSNGNLTYTGHSSTNYSGTYSSIAASSGKWYAEFKCTGGAGAVDMMIGAGTGITNTTAPGASTNDMVVFGYDGKYYAGGSGVSWGGDSWVSGDIIGVAMDLDNNKLYVSKNGTWMNSGDPTSGSTGTGALTLAASTNTGVYHFLLGDYGGSGTPICESNFGSGYFGTTAITNAGSNGNGALFEYDVPSGYYALNTKNIKDYG